MESRRFRRRRRQQSQMLDESSTSLGFKTKKRKLSEVRAEEFLGRTIEALYPSSSSETGESIAIEQLDMQLSQLYCQLDFQS